MERRIGQRLETGCSIERGTSGLQRAQGVVTKLKLLYEFWRHYQTDEVAYLDRPAHGAAVNCKAQAQAIKCYWWL